MQIVHLTSTELDCAHGETLRSHLDLAFLRIFCAHNAILSFGVNQSNINLINLRVEWVALKLVDALEVPCVCLTYAPYLSY